MCDQQVLEGADAELNRSYRHLTAQLRDGVAECGSGCTDALQSLKAAQRAWISFIDADCAAVHAIWIDGTGRNHARMQCLIDHTRLRTTQLQAML